MKKWFAGGVVVLLAVAGLAFAAYRQPQSGGPMMHREFRGMHGSFMGRRILALLDNDHFRSEINLTDDQAGRLRTIVLDTEKENIKTRAEMAVDAIDLRELLRADSPDQVAVMKKVQQVSELRGQLMKDNIQALLAAKSVLTPEQQKKIRETIERGFGRRSWGFRGMEHHWRPMPPGGHPSAPPATSSQQ